jgi:hypothetical protein
LVLLGWFGSASTQAQDVAPVDWSTLSPAAFADAAEVWLNSNPPPLDDERREVVALAWERFLDDPQFVSEVAWQDVSRLSAIFGAMWPLLEESPLPAPPGRVVAFRDALKSRLSTLPRAAEFSSLAANDQAMSSAGLSRNDLAPIAAQWMSGADWRGLSFADRVTLANLLHAEIVPRTRFAVRWTGTLTPAVSGECVFEQVRQHHVDGLMRMTLGDNLILDSQSSAETSPLSSSVRSAPVTLEAGVAMPVVVEYLYDADSMTTNREFFERIFPMAVLAWQRGDQPSEIVPADVFTAPDGQRGLRGEYFSSLQFAQPVGVRLDPGVQMVWSKQQAGLEIADEQIFSAFDGEQEQVVKHCVDEILQGDGLVQLSAEASFYESTLPRLLERLPARQRLAVVDELTRLPESLQATSALGVRFILPHVFMLSQQAVGDYLTGWVEVRSVEASTIREYPSWGAESFNRKTYDDYGWVGHFVRGANWPIAERLLEEHLEREDGSCNLMVAYCVGMAAVFDRKSEQMIAVMEERLGNSELTGDARATWLLARAFLEEVNVGGMPRPGRGLDFLEEASLVAESNEMQFRILQEIVARYGAAGIVKRAMPLLDNAEGRFPKYATEITAWRRQLADIEAGSQSPQQ